MAYLKTFPYNELGLAEIENWRYGKNWPVAYLIYNKGEVYVGETLDAVRRTQQHLQEDSLSNLTKITFITDKMYNKSSIIDLESFLIKYMSADGKFRLRNGNAGISNHDYFMKEIYEDSFLSVWKELIDEKLANNTLQAIENSNLFKYSPYKALGREQEDAILKILSTISTYTPGTKQTIIIRGGAGTGKTILAVFLVKMLIDLIDSKLMPENELFEFGQTIDFSNTVEKGRIGLVIPQAALAATVERVFDSVDGLDHSMVLRPKEVVKKKYDIMIVDEAHRLQRRKSLGQGYRSFDNTNAGLSLDKNGTQLDWVMRCSDIQVLFYDSRQTIRPSDIDDNQFFNILASYKPKLLTISLNTQFRCKAGAEYIQYVNSVLNNEHPATHKRFQGYDLAVFDHITDFWDAIQQRERQFQLCRVVSGVGWDNKCGKGQNSYCVNIEGHRYRFRKTAVNWVADPESVHEIGDIHKIQGYDLCYAGVIFGPEITYDTTTQEICTCKKKYHDNLGKQGVNDDQLKRYILNIYQTLLTRGIYGTYIYACNQELKTYLKEYFT